MKYLAISLAVLATIICSLSLHAQNASKPNVLIIFIDDMGYGDLGCYGNSDAKTKNIDALAKQGTRFTKFYVNSPVCSPSRVAMLTGQYPARHKFYTYLGGRKQNAKNKMPDYLPSSVSTLAKILHSNGYATGHFGKWHLGGGRDVGDAPLPTEYGFDKSFTSFEGLGDRTLTYADELNNQSAQLGRGNIAKAEQYSQTAIYVDSTLSFIKANKGKPFLVNFFPNDVHDPYNPAEGSASAFKMVTKDTTQQRFLATLKNLDEQVGRLLSGLKEMGLIENTIILLTSDNGPTDWPHYYKNGGTPPCSQGNLRGRKWSLYEGGVRVPFIAVWHGKIPAGKTNNNAVMSVIDIVPTVSAMVNAPLPAGYSPDGIDQSDVLLGKAQQIIPDLFWYYNNEPVPGNQNNISPKLAIRSGQWKLLMNPDGSQKQLYNLERDKLETKNVASSETILASAMEEKLKHWFDAMMIREK